MTQSDDSQSYFTLWELSCGAEAQDLLAVAVELGLFTQLAEGPKTIPEIATALGIKLRPAEVLAVTCASIGVLTKTGDAYGNVAEMEEFLVKDRSLYNQYTAFGRAGVVDEKRADKIRNALLTDQPARGAGWLDTATGVKRPAAAFYAKRHHLRIMWGRAIAAAYDFGPFARITDLGGATGGHLVGIVERFSHLDAVVFDLEYNQQAAEEGIRATDKTGRVRFEVGSFFDDDLPAGTDVFLMSHVLHDWGRDRCLTILRRSHEALPSGGIAVAAEFLLNEEKTGPLLAAFQGLHVFYNNIEARQYSGSEIAAMMTEVGYTDIEIRPIDREQSIVVGHKS